MKARKTWLERGIYCILIAALTHIIECPAHADEGISLRSVKAVLLREHPEMVGVDPARASSSSDYVMQITFDSDINLWGFMSGADVSAIVFHCGMQDNELLSLTYIYQDGHVAYPEERKNESDLKGVAYQYYLLLPLSSMGLGGSARPPLIPYDFHSDTAPICFQLGADAYQGKKYRSAVLAIPGEMMRKALAGPSRP
jgi:hypothetical protein